MKKCYHTAIDSKTKFEKIGQKACDKLFCRCCRLCGYEPFSDESDDDKVMFKKILNGAYEFHAPEWDEISESAKVLKNHLSCFCKC